MFKNVGKLVLGNVAFKKLHEQDFFAAGLAGDLDVLTRLIKQGLDPNIVDDEGMTVLHIAAEKDDIPVAKHLLSFKNVDINCHYQTRHGDTPLIFAVTFNRSQMAALLLQHRADPNVQNCFGQTALHRAVRKKNLTCVKALLFAKAQPNIEDAFGNTPLSLSVIEYPSIAIASMLLKWRANPEFRASDYALNTPRELAVTCKSSEHLNMMKLLADNKANLNVKDPISGLTPLHMVSITGYVPLAKLLLKLGANQMAQDRVGRTPFAAALEHGQRDLIRFYREREKMVIDIMENISFEKGQPEAALAKKRESHTRRNVRFSDAQTSTVESNESDEEMYLRHI